MRVPHLFAACLRVQSAIRKFNISKPVYSDIAHQQSDTRSDVTVEITTEFSRDSLFVPSVHVASIHECLKEAGLLKCLPSYLKEPNNNAEYISTSDHVNQDEMRLFINSLLIDELFVRYAKRQGCEYDVMERGLMSIKSMSWQSSRVNEEISSLNVSENTHMDAIVQGLRSAESDLFSSLQEARRLWRRTVEYLFAMHRLLQNSQHSGLMGMNGWDIRFFDEYNNQFQKYVDEYEDLMAAVNDLYVSLKILLENAERFVSRMEHVAE
jgi:hypothetical protein